MAMYYLVKKFIHFSKVLILGKFYRNTDTVRKKYDEMAMKKIEYFKASPPSLEDYMFRIDFFGSINSPDVDYRLVNDRIVHCSAKVPEIYLLNQFREHLKPYLGKKGTIIEFGSGWGRILLWLKSMYSETSFLGLELSSKNVELARMAANYFNLDVTFKNVDVTKELPEFPKDVLTCYSYQALEMMPKTSSLAADNMMKTTPNEAFFFEPDPTLYPYTFRGLVSRMRIHAIDRLRGLKPYLKKNYRLTYAKSTGYSTTALNEVCILRAENNK